MGLSERSDQWPDSHREITQRYFPEGVGPGGFDIRLMRDHAHIVNRGHHLHETTVKSWVLLYLLDRLEDAERLEGLSQLPEETEMPTDTQRIDSDIATGVQKIEHGTDFLRRIAEDREGRFESAREAGAKLAGEVYRFIEDPEGVGTDALREAYTTFMALDSGNFYVAGAVS